jgi:glycosyltransferase involved in cell wall biosynthesis
VTQVFDSPGAPPIEERSPTIVLTFCWSFGIPGGVGRHLQELARSLAAEGAKVLVVTLKTARHSRFPRPKLTEEFLGLEVEAELKLLGVEVIRPEPNPLHWMLDARVMKREVAKLLETRQVDAVLSFYYECAFLPDLCAAKGVPWGIVATLQSYAMTRDYECGHSGLSGKLRRRMFQRNVVASHRRAQLIFANSNFTIGELRDVLGVDVSKAKVTYLGVDPKFGAMYDDAEREQRGAVRNLLFFGRVIEEKGIFDALQALAKLKAAGYDDWKLRVLGTGDKQRLRQGIAHFGFEQHVEVLVHQDDKGLREQFAWADLAVLPSHAESFGLAIAEANCAGLPVVAFAAGSVPEVVLDGETAWLAPLGDIDALAACIRAAFDDPTEARRRGRAGNARVLETFRWDRTAKTILGRVAEVGSATDNSTAK